MNPAVRPGPDRIDRAWAALDDLLRSRCDFVRREFDQQDLATSVDVHDVVEVLTELHDAGPTEAREAAENELLRCLTAVGKDRIAADLALRLADADLRISIARRIYNDAVLAQHRRRGRGRRRPQPRPFDLVDPPGSFAISSVRPSARVLVVDPEGRVLLMRYHDPVGGPVWITPGGGLEPGEGLRAGAARELREETGIVAVPAELTGPVWFRRSTVSWKGRRIEGHEWYYLLGSPDTTVDSSGFTTAEAAFVEPPRWWDVAALAESGDRVVPAVQEIATLTSERLS